MHVASERKTSNHPRLVSTYNFLLGTVGRGIHANVVIIDSKTPLTFFTYIMLLMFAHVP